MYPLPRHVLDDLQSFVTQLESHFDGRLLELLPHEVVHHGTDELISSQSPRLLGPQEPHVVGGLLDLVLLHLLPVRHDGGWLVGGVSLLHGHLVGGSS